MTSCVAAQPHCMVYAYMHIYINTIFSIVLVIFIIVLIIFIIFVMYVYINNIIHNKY